MPGIGSSGPDDSDGNELVDLSSRRLPDEESQTGEHSQVDIQADVHLQSDNDEHESLNEISADESDRLWTEIKAETGYGSYVEYLKAYMNRYGYLWPLCVALRFILRRQDNRTSCCECAIYDINHADHRGPRMSLRCGSSSETKILSAIRQPLSTGNVRVILWEMWRKEATKGLPGAPRLELFDALGLGLRIQPRFFYALADTTTRREWLPPKFTERPLDPELFVIDQYVITIARNYFPANPDAMPVILIARLGPEELDFEEEIDDNVPFQKLATDELPKPVIMLPAWMLQYIRLLELDLAKQRESLGSVRDIFLRSLTALLHFNVSRIREGKDLMRVEYLKVIGPREEGEEQILDHERMLGKLFRMRSSLRRLIEDSEDKAERLKRVVHSQMANEVREGTSFTTIEDDLRQIRLESRRCETEIFDYLQLQTGELARQESKKSIQLSNFQIEEAKRVKIFTILAFVYIPLNLATSIFGMNIEQLNGNGQHIRVFIITAVVALAITGASWFVIEQVKSYRKWRRSDQEQSNRKTQFSLSVRFALITFLFSHRHTRWMFKSGAWWRLIVNHGSRLSNSYETRDGTFTAGEYVSMNIKECRDKVKDPYANFYLMTAGECRWTSAREKAE